MGAARGRGRGRGGGSWCASEDPGARAYTATTVFEGKARSRSSPGPGGSYFVTFVVQHVYKDGQLAAVGGAVAAPSLRVRSQVRLQFVEPPPAASPGPPGPRAAARHAAQCEDLSRLAPAVTEAAAAPVRVNVKHGGKFIIFADRVGPHNFTVRGPPLPRSRTTVHAIRAVLCPNCGELTRRQVPRTARLSLYGFPNRLTLRSYITQILKHDRLVSWETPQIAATDRTRAAALWLLALVHMRIPPSPHSTQPPPGRAPRPSPPAIHPSVAEG